jgi:hypothetical protein
MILLPAAMFPESGIIVMLVMLSVVFFHQPLLTLIPLVAPGVTL